MTGVRRSALERVGGPDTESLEPLREPGDWDDDGDGTVGLYDPSTEICG